MTRLNLGFDPYNAGGRGNNVNGSGNNGGSNGVGGTQGAPSADGGSTVDEQVAALVDAIRNKTKSIEEITAALQALGIAVSVTKNKLGQSVFEFDYGDKHYKVTYGTRSVGTVKGGNNAVVAGEVLSATDMLATFNKTEVATKLDGAVLSTGGGVVVGGGSSNNYNTDLNSIKDLLENLKNGVGDINEFKKKVEDYYNKYSDNSDAKSKLDELYRDFKSEYADRIINGQGISSGYDPILGAFSGIYANRSFVDILGELINKLKSNNSGLTSSQLKDIITIYFSELGLSSSEIEDLKNMLKDTFVTKENSSGNGTIALTDEDLENLKNTINEKFDQYKMMQSLAEVLIARINEVINTLNGIIKNANNENIAPNYDAILSTIQELLDDVRAWVSSVTEQNTDNGFGLSITGMALDIANQLLGITGSMNNANNSDNTSPNTDNDSMEELNNITGTIYNLADLLSTITFDDLVNNLNNSLFDGRENVSTDELFAWLQIHYRSGNVTENNSDNNTDNESDITISLGSGGSSSISKTLRAMGISSDDDVNEITNEVSGICEMLQIDISDIKISYVTLVSKLSAKFGGKTDVTKEEVLVAIRNIFIEEAFKKYTEGLTTQNGDENSNQNIGNSVTSILDDINIGTNITMEEITDLTYLITRIVDLFAELRTALEQGNNAEALDLINTLQSAINQLRNAISPLTSYDNTDYDHNDDSGAIIPSNNGDNTDNDEDDMLSDMQSLLNHYQNQLYN